MPAELSATTDDHQFAHALRAAVESSGLGLARLQQRLHDSGTSISLATLSYWQSGRSVPARPSSLLALSELERVLGVETGGLVQLLPSRNTDASRSRSKATAAAADSTGAWLPEPFAELDARLSRSLDVVSEHLQIVVGPDRAQRSRRIRRIMRARADGVDEFILTDVTADPSLGPPKIVPLMHCKAGDVQTVEAGAVMLARIQFDRSLNKGESIMVELQVDYPAPHLSNAEHRLKVRDPVREFMLEVCFAAQARPSRCEWYDRSESTGERAQVLELNAASCILVVRHHLSHGVYGLRWSWD